MSRNQYKSTIEQEIEKLNEKIDLRIIKGLSYKREARRHKTLLSRLAHIEHARSSFSFFSLFL